ncbi:hypothetical protein ACJJIK_02375 [Microbulbifer sp. ZKSA006]|uniref:hypothetical protein n=1 Tax=Microbulbifer sp. ZKSA006 TaxID=3243390 RepID=UPI00403A0AFC
MQTIQPNTVQAAGEAAEWGLAHGLAFKKSDGSAIHVPFSFTPSTIDLDHFEALKKAAPLLARLIHTVSEDHQFLHEAISPVAQGDAFFSALLVMHQQIKDAARLPLLIMRSDFMDDIDHGPKLVEFNGIAAGMGPFGQRIHELHQFIQSHYPEPYTTWSKPPYGPLIDNPSIERLSQGLAEAASTIKNEFKDGGSPVFLMVVQEDEDNIFDQHLLEYALAEKGVRTVRKTFRELNESLASGPGNRLLLQGVGPIDCVYLRTGYNYCDYVAKDLDGERCCETLMQTRILLENHRVAINATVSQQLATSKRVQMTLSSMPAQELTRFNLSLDEAISIKSLLGDIRPISADTLEWFSKQDSAHWVLKNQGEGGGHCIFDRDIMPKLKQLSIGEYPAWALMQRLNPAPRSGPALIVRNSEPHLLDDLISEIGLFTILSNGKPATLEQGYAGYLTRSKSSRATEGGVHSGNGVLDSLMLNIAQHPLVTP